MNDTTETDCFGVFFWVPPEWARAERKRESAQWLRQRARKEYNLLYIPYGCTVDPNGIDESWCIIDVFYSDVSVFNKGRHRKDSRRGALIVAEVVRLRRCDQQFGGGCLWQGREKCLFLRTSSIGYPPTTTPGWVGTTIREKKRAGAWQRPLA